MNRIWRWLLGRLDGENGASTVEYVLVIIAAAGIALALITWVGGTGAFRQLFNAVARQVIGYVG
ncbi:MAG TPA: DUF4244 domain-containing protein [Acidimicrobiia bacterium]|nr:DUF4244 domain-containing protein [Acidimicrobiia bacterium]